MLGGITGVSHAFSTSIDGAGIPQRAVAEAVTSPTKSQRS